MPETEGPLTLGKKDLIEMLRIKAGMTKPEAFKFTHLVLDEMAAVLSVGNSIRLSDFGTFKVRRLRKRPGFDFKNKRQLPPRDHAIIKFKPTGRLGRAIKALVKQPPQS